MLLVYCLHGDEVATEKIALRMEEKLGIEIYLGNPVARRRKVRFVESDLNRSFNKRGTREAKRAIVIKKALLHSKHNLIIDLHATKAVMPPCAIITDLKQLYLVARTGIKRVIYFTQEFSSGGSLIENIPNAFSIEIYPSKESIKFLENAVALAAKGKIIRRVFDVYFVIEIVKGKTDLSIQNFKKFEDGSYPLFSGEPAYRGIKFLRARKKNISLKSVTSSS